MKEAPLPGNEQQRLDALRRLEVLDTPPERAFDDLVTLVSELCGVPIALVSLVDEKRQWFKACIGLRVTETPRDQAFCAHAILDDKPLVIEDALADERFRDNPLVTSDPSIRFYAGVPLVTENGFALGTLCAIDRVPRSLDQEQLAALSALARQVVRELELRQKVVELKKTQRKLKKTTRRLERSNGELHQFAHIVSHDLQEPLRTVVGFLGLLRKRVSDRLDEESLEYIQISVEAAKRMQDQVQGLLEFAGVTGTRGRVEEMNLDNIVTDVVDSLAASIEEAGARVELKELPVVPGRRQLITVVFQNLIGNAIKYRRQGTAPEIEVSAHRTDDEWEIRVRDNGGGIEPAYQNRIFDMYFRGNGSRVAEGNGLGLALCQRIVSDHGGDIWLERSDAAGSEFRFTLPVDKVAVTP